MFIYKGYNFRLYPNQEDTRKLNQCIGSSRFVYNYYLDKKDKMYESTGKNWSLKDMCANLVGLESEYEWLKEVDSCALRTSLFDLDDAYTRFFKNFGSHPKFKSKHSRNSYRTNCIRSSYKGKDYSNIKVDLEKRTIQLPKLGEIKIRGYRNLRKLPGRIINATVSREGNRYYVSVCVQENIDIPEFKLRNIVGIDLGVKNLVVASTGLKYKAMDAIKRRERKIRGLNKWLSRCQKGSKNRLKVIAKLQAAYRKLRNARKYYTHLITSTLVKENDIIVMETLKVKDMIEQGKNNMPKYLSDSSLGEITRQLEYKCKWAGKKLIKVPTYFASSQICNHCGNQNKEIKNLNIRKWTCLKCNCNNDRDINASLNILEKGIFDYFKKTIKKSRRIKEQI